MINRVYIIGAGKVGSSLAFELRDKGYSIDFITDRNEDNLKKLSSLIHPVSYSCTVDMNFICGSDIVFICVQDRFIKDIINEINNSGLDFKDKY